MPDDHCHVDDDEQDVEADPHEVQAPHGLTASKEFQKPGKARGQSRRHGDAGDDLKWRQDEDQAEVSELLKRVEWVAARRNPELQVDRQGAPRIRNNLPGRGNEPAPLRCD